MRRKKFVLFLVLALFTGWLTVFSPTAYSQTSGSMLKMVFIQADSPAEVRKLVQMGIDIAAVRKPGTIKGQEPGYRVEAAVSAFDEMKLRKAGFTWTDAPRPLAARARQGESVYHSFDEPVNGIRAKLEAIAQNYPGIATLKTIGHSLNNRPVLAICLTAGPRSFRAGFWNIGRLDKPEVLYLATHHAREWAATQMAMRLIKYLVENFGKVNRVSNLLLTTEIWIIPVANPDGYEYTFTNERLWRRNLRDNDGDGLLTPNDGVDPNRNFDSRWWGLDDEGSSSDFFDGTYRGPAPNSEPITRAVADFILEHDFKSVISYHTSGNLILYAWGWQGETSALDDPIFVAQSGTDEKPAIWDSIMNQGYDPGVGGDLYTVNGDFADWCYEKGIPGFTLELTAGYDSDGIYYGFEFPDDENMVQTVFEDNINFALCIAESAKDPAHPVSPVGIVVEDVYHTPVTDSRGPNQVIDTLARKELSLEVSYSVNGGEKRTAGFTEALGNRYNDQSGVYFSKYRAVISGQAAGDSVTYSITGGENAMGPYTYSVTSASGAPVLIISAEDYTGENPVYVDHTGPNYLRYYTDALDAAGYGYDVYDITARATAPSPIETLSHYGAVIWYTGDSYDSTVPGPDIHQDIFLNLRDYMNYHNGRLFVTGQDLALQSAFYGYYSDDFFQYYLGAYNHLEGGGISADGLPYDVKGEAGDPVFDGLNFSLYGGDGANNQYTTDVFTPTPCFLPHFDQSVAAGYDRPGRPYEPHSGDYYAYAQMGNASYKRLGGTFTLPDGAPALTFWISYAVEPGWDYAFVEISEAGSDVWTTLPDQNGMTVQDTGDSCESGQWAYFHPFLANYMDADCNPAGATGEWHAFNGNSFGWHQVVMDLSAYAGKTVELYISSVSDWGFQDIGVFVDDIEVSGSPLEDFENSMGSFFASVAPESRTVNNWIRTEGDGLCESAAILSPNSVYLGFGFEGVDTAENRAEIMKRVMEYLMP